LNPQLMQQLLGMAGGQPGQQLGPESLMAILSSLGLGRGMSAPGAGTVPGLQSASMSTLLPQLLQMLMGGQQSGQVQGGGGQRPGSGRVSASPGGGPGMASGGGGMGIGQGGQMSDPGLQLLQLLGFTRGGIGMPYGNSIGGGGVR